MDPHRDSIVVENTKFATLLVQKGGDLSHRDDHNVTVVIQASHKGQVDVVGALVERAVRALQPSDLAPFQLPSLLVPICNPPSLSLTPH